MACVGGQLAMPSAAWVSGAELTDARPALRAGRASGKAGAQAEHGNPRREGGTAARGGMKAAPPLGWRVLAARLTVLSAAWVS
jgi:hypothetical protein